MSSTPTGEREIDRAEIVAIVERTRSSLSPEEYAKLKAFTELNLWLLGELDAIATRFSRARFVLVASEVRNEWLLQAMQVPDLTDGVLRLSFSHYNSEEEVARCVAALREILAS